MRCIETFWLICEGNTEMINTEPMKNKTIPLLFGSCHWLNLTVRIRIKEYDDPAINHDMKFSVFKFNF